VKLCEFGSPCVVGSVSGQLAQAFGALESPQLGGAPPAPPLSPPAALPPNDWPAVPEDALVLPLALTAPAAVTPPLALPATAADEPAPSLLQATQLLASGKSKIQNARFNAVSLTAKSGAFDVQDLRNSARLNFRTKLRA
jgi:hypothetical protein